MNRNTKPTVAALLMLSQLMGGCGAHMGQAPAPGRSQSHEDKGTGTAAQSQSPQAAPPFAGEAEVITGTSTPHKQKDAPVETERISGKQLEEAGATHAGQVLQDVPVIQRGR